MKAGKHTAAQTISEQPVPFWTPGLGIASGTLGVIALLVLLFGNLVTGALLVVITLSMLNGRWLGAAKVAAGVAGMLVAMLLAVPVGGVFEGLWGAMLGTTGLINRMTSIGLCGVMLAAAVGTGLSIPIGRYLKKRPSWRRSDRLIGTGLGALEGVLFGVVLIWGVLALEPVAARAVAQAAEPGSTAKVSPGARAVIAVARSARGSTAGWIAGTVNPLKDMRIITLLGDAQAVLSDPVAREAFLNHPAIAAIRERQSVQDALARLSADPPLLDLEDGIDEEELRELLRSPRFLTILDETDLLSDLSSIAGDIEGAIRDVRQGQP